VWCSWYSRPLLWVCWCFSCYGSKFHIPQQQNSCENKKAPVFTQPIFFTIIWRHWNFLSLCTAGEWAVNQFTGSEEW
jgi:hypothetical protein